MAHLHPSDKFSMCLVSPAAFPLHKQLAKTNSSGFFCSSLCLLFLLSSEIFPFESLQCVSYSCSSPPHTYPSPWAFFFLETCVQTPKAAPLPTRCVWVCQEQILNYWQGEKSPGWGRPWRYPVSSEVPARIEIWLFQGFAGVTSGWQPVTSGVSASLETPWTQVLEGQ